jgi:hypothetical protein
VIDVYDPEPTWDRYPPRPGPDAGDLPGRPSRPAADLVVREGLYVVVRDSEDGEVVRVIDAPRRGDRPDGHQVLR